ncbi:hypothetical protein AAFC00_007141 [Neodothiora populina]|uniref:Uncharacterized protein n=1 Tax=Neodothiora populina TaxID=2781224 RepID=A0ABR3PII0_9PEZI
MNTTAARSSAPAGLRVFRSRFSTSVIRRNQGPSYQSPTPPSSPPPPPPASNPHRDFYKSFGRPIAKVFLMAWATYQITYWTWSKLDFMEQQGEKEEELRRLESELHATIESNEKHKTITAATSAAGVSPVDPLAHQVSSSSRDRSWWKFF